MTLCFFTFWGGLLYFLGHEKYGSVSSFAQVLTTVALVSSNSLYLCVAGYLFISQYLHDRRTVLKRKSIRELHKKLSLVKVLNTVILPANRSHESGDESGERGDERVENAASISEKKKCEV